MQREQHATPRHAHLPKQAAEVLLSHSTLLEARYTVAGALVLLQQILLRRRFDPCRCNSQQLVLLESRMATHLNPHCVTPALPCTDLSSCHLQPLLKVPGTQISFRSESHRKHD